MGDRYSYRQGSAEALPFEDQSFDLVTCQTVLIHVADPRAVIREMARVTKPGGLVLASEPNNHVVTLNETSANADLPVAQRAEHVGFYLTCERGKIALGEGNMSVAELVPGYFADEGLTAIQAYVCDKTVPMVPPYERDDQRAMAAAWAEEAEYGGWAWSRDETRRFYLAGGGSEAEFDDAWERRRVESRAVLTAIENGTFTALGGPIMYLVGGRRSA
jgi:SAM-dependent methyltransferase